MTWGDSQSVFQLLTALNIGFCAFDAIREPAAQRVRSSIRECELWLHGATEMFNRQHTYWGYQDYLGNREVSLDELWSEELGLEDQIRSCQTSIIEIEKELEANSGFNWFTPNLFIASSIASSLCLLWAAWRSDEPLAFLPWLALIAYCCLPVAAIVILNIRSWRHFRRLAVRATRIETEARKVYVFANGWAEKFHFREMELKNKGRPRPKLSGCLEIPVQPS